MNCPNCGSPDLNGKEFACGTKTYANIRGESCYEAEIEKLRDKKAKGLTWRHITCECYEANGFNGTWRIVYDSQSRGFDVLLDSEFVKETKTRIPAEAKAHAEELHQQAWRELLDKWSAK